MAPGARQQVTHNKKRRFDVGRQLAQYGYHGFDSTGRSTNGDDVAACELARSGTG
ncbi:MAG: hypothetical protein ACXWC3_21995 [Burkholderiales bacterium]